MNRTIKKILHKNISEILSLSKNDQSPLYHETLHYYIMDPNSVALMMTNESKIYGYILCYLEDDNKILIIDRLIIDDEYRRLGHGSHLMNLLVASCRNKYLYNDIYTKVQEDNLTAQLFLQSLGFKYTTTLPRNLMNGKNAYLMRLNVNESNVVDDSVNLATN